jgi:YVTN family beta-propeller protein
VVVAPAASASPPLPPEEELSLEFELPHAGERYVYAVNPDSDSVAVIDANTLAIHSVEAGDQPTFLQTLAGRDAAIVLNVRSGDATLIRTADGQSEVLSVPVQSGANAIAVAPDGNHAVVYFNSSYRGAGASGSFQDISVLFLEEGKERAEAMTVGFRPSSVAFSADGTRAFVVTEDGVSLLDFAQIESEGPAIARTVPLGDDATASLDVSVTPDGKYALARREGDSELRLVNLETEHVMLLDLATELAAVSDPIVELDAGPLLLVTGE